MSTRDEEIVYSQLMNNAPKAEASAVTLESEANLHNAEQSIVSTDDYSSTADAKLDSAINEWLNSRGFNYNTATDKDYQEYVKQFKQNAQTGRQLSKQTAKTLANGYNPTYADAVASEVYNQQMENITDAIPTFKNLATQQYNAEQAKLGNVVNLYSNESQRDYNRYRDTVSDNKNFLNYLYDRYATDRQSDIENDAYNASIYDTKLSAAQSNLAEARNYDNQRYLYDTQSADNVAQIAEQEYENNQKINYEKALDEYEAKITEQEDKKNGTKNANAIFAGMKSKDDFDKVSFDSKGVIDEEDIDDSEKIFDDSGIVTYEVYAKEYIDNQFALGNIDKDEKDYLYQKAGITGESSSYYNSGIADSFISAYSLDRANDDYIKTQLAIGYEKGQIGLADVQYIKNKFNIKGEL